MTVVLVLIVFVLGVVVGSCFNFNTNRSIGPTWAERQQMKHVHDVQHGISPMQDTSPHMYNRHGVHKHNPMLDR